MLIVVTFCVEQRIYIRTGLWNERQRKALERGGWSVNPSKWQVAWVTLSESLILSLFICKIGRLCKIYVRARCLRLVTAVLYAKLVSDKLFFHLLTPNSVNLRELAPSFLFSILEETGEKDQQFERRFSFLSMRY